MPVTDLFCTVIDNYGDIGVCWRLARQLHHEYDEHVRLWVDDLITFSRLAPNLKPADPIQMLDGIEVRHWTATATTGVMPGDRVIEGFGCRLPPGFLQAMANKTPKPVWINLEYLSAEPWTLDCHGLPSPHPDLPLRQRFFFPGFDPRSGGLLREKGLLDARDAFQADTTAMQAFWDGLGHPDAMTHDWRISLFAYEQPAIPALLDTLAGGRKSVFIAIPESRVLEQVGQWAGRAMQAGETMTRGKVRIAILPFLSNPDYDRLLWACDLNAIRGEDSLIRAHWAGRPLLWHIYPQAENAHLTKLNAWLDLYRATVPPAWSALQLAWNQPSAAVDWGRLLTLARESANGFRQFTDKLSAQPDLAARLADFSAKE